MEILLLAIVAGVVALAFAAYLAWKVMQSDEGNERVRFIGNAIREGSMAFLSREYRLLAVFVVVCVFAIIWVFVDYDILNKVEGDGDPMTFQAQAPPSHIWSEPSVRGLRVS